MISVGRTSDVQDIVSETDSLAQRTPTLASACVPARACRIVLAMECGHGANPFPKIKVLLCELILMFFIRRDWNDSVSKTSPGSYITSFDEVRVSDPDKYEIVNLLPHEPRRMATTPKTEMTPCCDPDHNGRSLLSRRSWMGGSKNLKKQGLMAEGDGDSASFMMVSKSIGRGGAGRGRDHKDERKKEDRPRRQKQPNGNCIRRRAPLRRRTVRQRLAEKQVLCPNRSHTYRQQAALDREVRGILARRPEDERGIGLSNPELRHLETMLRGDGGCGLSVVVASMLQMIATIASDMAVMLQIVSMDMDRDHDMEEIAPMPPHEEQGEDRINGRPEGEVEEDDDDRMESCAASSSGRPPRRRRVPQQGTPKAAPKATPKSRPNRGRRTEASTLKDKTKEGAKVDAKTKLAKSIAVAPWRTKIARQKWLIKKSHGHHATRSTPRSRTARSSMWCEEEDEEDVIDCEEAQGNQDHTNAEREDVRADEAPEEHNEEQSVKEANDTVEVEIDDEEDGGDGGDGGGDGGDDEDDYDEMQLMQQDKPINGKQLGTLGANQRAEFVETFKENYVTMLYPAVERPVKMALLRGTRSKLPGVRSISKVLLAQIQTLKLAESKSGLPSGKIRNAVRRAGKLCHNLEEDMEDDKLFLMQCLQSWLARMLQQELDMMQAMQKGVGAKLKQLMQLLASLESKIHDEIRDLMEMLKAVMATFEDDDIDEGKPDEVDQWTQAWMRRIQVWFDMESFKLSNVVTVDDSADAEIEEGATKESGFVEMVVELQKHLMAIVVEEEKARLARSVAMAQEWEAWIVKQAMDNPASPKRQRTVSTQVDPGMIADDSIDRAYNECHEDGPPHGDAEGNGSVSAAQQAPLQTESGNVVQSVHDEVPVGGEGVDVELVAATVPESTQES